MTLHRNLSPPSSGLMRTSSSIMSRADPELSLIGLLKITLMRSFVSLNTFIEKVQLQSFSLMLLSSIVLRL